MQEGKKRQVCIQIHQKAEVIIAGREVQIERCCNLNKENVSSLKDASG